MARTARAAIADTGLFLPHRNRDEKDNTLRGEQDGAHFGVSQRQTRRRLLSSFSIDDTNTDTVTRSTTPPAAPMDRAWAIAFWVNVCITVLTATFVGVAGVSGVAAAATRWSALLNEMLITWVVWQVSCILCILCYTMVWPQIRLRFGAANLKVAALAVRSMPGTIYLTLFGVVMRVVWFVLSALSAVGSFAAFSPVVVGADGTTYSFLGCQDIAAPPSPYGGGETTAGSGLSCHCGGEVISSDSGCEFSGGGFQRSVLAFFWCWSFTWGLDVLRNVVSATVAGSVASWWFSPRDANSVRGAFYRATHSSFGSLCKAPATEMADMWGRAISRCGRISSSTGPNSAHVFSSSNLMSSYRNLGAVGHASAYAICFIGIYGLDFSEALRRGHELFVQTRGITMNAEKGIVELMLLVLSIAISSYLVVGDILVKLTAQFSGMVGFDHFVVVVPFFVLETVCFWTTMPVLRQGQEAVFVCFVQDPEALANNHGSQTYDDLSREWQQQQMDRPAVTSSNIPHVPIATSPEMVEINDHRATTHTEYQV